MNRIYLIIDQSVLMLYRTAFYEMINRPYILESYIIDILLFSFSHPFIYPHPSIFASQQIDFSFLEKNISFQLLQLYDRHIIY